MRHVFSVCLLAVLVTGCVAVPEPDDLQGESREAGMSTDVLRPKPRPATVRVAPRPPQTARTVEQFDTTSTEERAAAAAAPERAERSIGTTIASLGTPTEPGFWLKTPLVRTEQPGRVVYPANGKSVQVTLIPIEGPSTAGSRMSLAALRLIEAPLTGLPEVQVFAGG